MEIFDKVEEAIESGSKIVIKKAKDTADIISLKAQISTCEDVIKQSYSSIGKKYYEMYADSPNEEFAKQCKAIANAKRAIADLEERITDIKESV